MIMDCADQELPLPAWATAAFREALDRRYKGKLKSWDEVFDKPYSGKTRKGTATQSRIVEVWLEVRRLHDVEGRPLDEGTFEDVGKKLGVGRKSTVSRLYWLFDRVVREFEKAEKSGHVLLPRLRSHRPKSSA